MKKFSLSAAIILGIFVFAVSFSSAQAQQTTVIESDDPFGQDVEFRAPQPRIDLPGLEFSDFSDKNIQTVPGEGSEKKLISVPFLGEYIAAVYKYAVAVASILAVVMIIVAGFQWAASGGNTDSISSAKDRIKNAVTGLIIALGSYTLLYTINPELVQFRQLKIFFIETKNIEEYHDEAGALSQPVEVVSGVATPSRPNIQGGRISRTPETLKADMEKVADALVLNDYGMYITSGYRTPEEQTREIVANCENPTGPDRCSPKAGRHAACKMIAGAGSCPHTSGRALDIFGMRKDGSRWVRCLDQGQCKALGVGLNGGCRKNSCQAALIQEMKNQGFCVLDSEPWHFEKPVASTGACH